jgi:hypothetical protein
MLVNTGYIPINRTAAVAAGRFSNQKKANVSAFAFVLV